MKCIALTFLLVFVLHVTCFNACAEHPVISDSEVRSINLFLGERGGAIDGYLIFYDNQGRQCAVDGPDFLARLYCGWRSMPDFEKTFSINPASFKIFTTKGGDVFYGFVIDSFVVDRGWKNKDGYEKVTINFEWGDLKANTTVTKY